MKIGKKQVKYLCMILCGTNISSIILGIIHYIIYLNIVIETIFSIIIVFSWFLNIILIIFNEFKINKSSSTGAKINLLGYGFIGVQIISIFFLIGGLFLLNANWFSPLLHYSLILLGFLSFFTYGAIFSYLSMKALDNREVWKFE